jgi:hypothetical protein
MIAAVLLTMALLPAFTELPAQTLEPGQCAMALWDRSSGQRIAFWRAAGPLLLAAGPAPQNLTAVPGSGSGAPVLGLLPEARFTADGLSAQLAVNITINPNGQSATISGGTLTLTAEDGEARITPVVGIIGCG